MAALQVEEFIVQRLVRIPFHRLANEIGHLVGILAAGGYSDASRPVVVQVAQFVAQPLQYIRLVIALVVHHDVVSGRDAALTDRLRHQEVIEVVAPGNGMVQHRARIRVFQVVAVDAEHSGVDAFLDDNERY